MAGTIVADVIQSDQSYPSSINIASPMIVSNAITMTNGAISGNVNFDSNTLFVDATSNRVGIGRIPTNVFDISGASSPVTINSTNSNLYKISFTDNSVFRGFIGAGDDAPFAVANSASVTVASIDNIGRLSLPNQPAFSAHGTGNQSWSGTANYQVLQISVKNTIIPSGKQSYYNTSTYRFTAPVAGTYAFFHGFTATAAVTGPESRLRVNGSTVQRISAIGYTYSGGFFTASSFELLYLNVNDYVEVQVINNNNVSMTIDLARSYFGGYLIG